MSLHILVLGTLISEKQGNIFLQYGIRPAPADIVQKYLIAGLCTSHHVETVDAICSPRIHAYPKTKIKKVQGEAFKIDQCTVESLGYLNVPMLGFAQREQRLVSSVKKWAKNQIGNDVLVLIYSMHSPFLHAAKKAKDILPNARIALIVPDLPQYMAKGGGLRKFLKRLDRKKIDYYLPVVDKYILYTKHMADYFGLQQDQWMVCEGLTDVSKISVEIRHKNVSNVCMYAGSLDPQYALDKLISSFERANIQAELHLYGNPREAEALMKKHPDCKKTKYMGILSQTEIFEKMKEAKLLINPRPSNLELTKYSCPSKTFEYMASGTPVLMTKLSGLPEEYHPYLFFFEDETEDGFVHTLESMFSLDCDQLLEMGTKAASFIKENKGYEKQTKRIVEFCN